MDYDDINKRIIDRRNSFYWQSNRKISIAESEAIFQDRHKNINADELLISVNKVMNNNVKTIMPIDLTDQTSFGTVNSVRIAKLENGREILIRCHPKGVQNGYFFVEKLATTLAKNHGIPCFDVYAIHELEDSNDIAFQVIEKCNGYTLKRWFDMHPEDIPKLLFKCGEIAAKLNQIQTEGYGSFDNEQAKKGVLHGYHSSFKDSILTSITEDINRLIINNIINTQQAKKIMYTFSNTDLLATNGSFLIHNDFSDWNILTDGKEIISVLDWDECIASDPISEIACWSTFYDKSLLNYFINGYFSDIKIFKENYEKFELLRLRYLIMKMSLRTERYKYKKLVTLKQKIISGKEELLKSMDRFKCLN
ncbi:MAG: aminoglycoside phosphotransferase family protein [Alistipes senegalensis]|nr:aminoglycoside phosphotransferase family protein [Alistipes senegalensis]